MEKCAQTVVQLHFFAQAGSTWRTFLLRALFILQICVRCPGFAGEEFFQPSTTHSCESSRAWRWRGRRESRLPGDLPPIGLRDCWCNSARCGHTHRSLPARARKNNNHSNNTIWRGSVSTGEKLPLHSGELNHALFPVGGPTQSQLSRPMSSGHHIS